MKEINLFLIDEKEYKVIGIVSTKVNTFIKYQFWNGAVV